MFKKLFITILLVFSLNGHAFAHTGLESSSPQNGETISEEIQQITLTFETKIEQTSTIQLKGADGKEIPVKDITINDKQMVGNLEAPLNHGDYQVLWNIIGADGHPIEGTFTFNVSVNKPNTEEDSNLEEANTPSQSEINSDVTDNPSTNQTEADEETPGKITFQIHQMKHRSIIFTAKSVTFLFDSSHYRNSRYCDCS